MRFASFAVVMLAVCFSATATPVCVQGSLATYVATGANGCTIGDKLFYNFDYSGSGSGGATAIPVDGVTVSPLDLQFNPGLTFEAAWTVGPGQTLDSLIIFSVLVLSGGASITDISAAMEGYGFVADGIVAVAETTSVGNLLLYDSAGLGLKAFDRLDIAATSGPITVHKDISVNGNNGLATVSAVTNLFSEQPIPEAAGSLLIGSGLLMLGIFRRHRQS